MNKVYGPVQDGMFTKWQVIGPRGGVISEHLTRQEAEEALRSKQVALLRKEKPQDSFLGGFMEQWTLIAPYYDRQGYNRMGSTFTRNGLAHIGITLEVR